MFFLEVTTFYCKDHMKHIDNFVDKIQSFVYL
jgi:hypothetical protein